MAIFRQLATQPASPVVGNAGIVRTAASTPIPAPAPHAAATGLPTRFTTLPRRFTSQSSSYNRLRHPPGTNPVRISQQSGTRARTCLQREYAASLRCVWVLHVLPLQDLPCHRKKRHTKNVTVPPHRGTRNDQTSGPRRLCTPKQAHAASYHGGVNALPHPARTAAP